MDQEGKGLVLGYWHDLLEGLGELVPVVPKAVRSTERPFAASAQPYPGARPSEGTSSSVQALGLASVAPEHGRVLTPPDRHTTSQVHVPRAA